MSLENDIILSVDELRVIFGVAPYSSGVKGISFVVRKGRTLAIVGESGSGKTVSSLAILGLIPPRSWSERKGRASLSGVEGNLLELPLSGLQKIRGNRISMVFQEPMTSLNPLMSCGKQVAEVLQIHERLSGKAAKIRTIELFSEVQLPRAAYMFDQYPHEISGGQKQRVMIAMAIACSPDLLIADEPTTALDVTVQHDIIRLLKDLQRKSGMAMIFITHDLALVSEIADDVVVMRQGEVIESGNVQEVFTNPKASYTRGLLACRPGKIPPQQTLPTVQDIEAGRVVSYTGANSAHVPVEKLLVVKNLSKIYPSVKAVDNVSFDVYSGETLGLVGESGCGKTTLSRMLLRLIEPTEGVIEFENKDILNLGKTELRSLRKKIQIIFQDPYSSLNPRMAIGNAIVETMLSANLYARERKEKAIELLEKVGLKAIDFHKYPHEFSGGQKQRVVIARTLAVEPRFVICDESVSALDVSVQAQVLNLLNELKKDFGLTYIFISHDLAVVRHMSDRIMVMKNGKIEEIGPANEVFANPVSAYTKSLLQAMPHLAD